MRVSFSTLILLKHHAQDSEAAKALRQSKALLVPAHNVNMTVGCFFSGGQFQSKVVPWRESNVTIPV